jgi:hypothetical protein
VPLPRLLGSGVRKILTLPHRLEDHVLYFFTLSSHSSQPGIGSFKQGRTICFGNNSPGLRRSWTSRVSGAIGAFLGAVATDVSVPLTIETLHLVMSRFWVSFCHWKYPWCGGNGGRSGLSVGVIPSCCSAWALRHRCSCWYPLLYNTSLAPARQTRPLSADVSMAFGSLFGWYRTKGL